MRPIPTILCFALVVYGLFAGALPALGSDPSGPAGLSALEPGGRIRLRTENRPKTWIETVYAGVRGDSLLYGGEPASLEPQTIQWAKVVSLERSRGQKRHILQGIGVGLVGGGVIGYLIGTAANRGDPGPGSLLGGHPFSGSWDLVGAMGGAAIGCAVGGTIGAFVRTTSWERVPISGAAGGMEMRSEAGVRVPY